MKEVKKKAKCKIRVLLDKTSYTLAWGLWERHFVATFILQYSSKKKKKKKITHSLNWIIIMVICVQFITVVSLHIYSLLKVRLIFHPKKKKVRLLFFF